MPPKPESIFLIKTLALEWGPHGVRCNWHHARANRRHSKGMRRLAPPGEARERSIRQVPLRRYGTKDELADLALFLSSDAASYMTGAVYYCDGGSAILGTFHRRRSLSRNNGHAIRISEHAP